ncbi:uncharacterized protein [Dendropsophus ebraccatus]|uniref:uncharacterized protein n=1 Tax=Dendropsophus ebraccatus TaxID=150705 RepID=UPI003831828F
MDQQEHKGLRWQVTISILFSWLCHSVSGQIHYSIVEEMRKDSVIANIADDLGLDIKQLSSRKLRIVSRASERYFYVSLETGNLYIKDRIDRETLCGTEASCYLTFDAVIEAPFNIFKVKVEIQDINDNSPYFFHDKFILEIIEFTLPGARFVLQNAEDPDIGSNSVQTYKLSDNPFFSLGESINPDESKSPELVLEKPLDREMQSIHELFLTAIDGGNPLRSGTSKIKVIVTDGNDNAPIFSDQLYKVSLKETIPVNSTVLIVNATDIDEGVNAQITYSFSKKSGNIHHTGFFSIHPIKGEIKTERFLDFEETKTYELSVQAKDGGGLVGHAKILVEVKDENDNAPDISITSLSTPIPEDSEPGTMIALIEVHDQDSGENGDIDCHIIEDVPFNLLLSSDKYYRIVSGTTLDREKLSMYNITIIATDRGSTPLSSKRIITLEISDINDNPPMFDKSTYVVYVPENNLPGASIFSIHASDPDTGDNAKIIYSISSTITENLSMSSYLSINIETGVFYAQRSFDYEQNKEFTIEITATDNGSPSLSSNATLIIHIVDQNDNAPKILYPSSDIGGSAVFEMVPFASEPGSLITKVVAVDADSGHNSWLSYHFLQVSDPNHFVISEHTGEIRTLHSFQEKDMSNYKIFVMVKDNGNPSLSATTTLSLIIADDFQQVVPKLKNQPKEEETQNNLQLYLVVALALISLLFIITVMVVIISKCKQPKPSAAFSSLTTNLYPPIDPRTFSMYSDASLPFPYSYNVCVALDSAEGDFTYMNPNGNVPVENLMDADNAEQGSECITEASPIPDQDEVSGQIHYSIVEEMRKDSVIANIADDLGLDIKQLSSRKLRIVSRASKKYFYVNKDNGNLYVKDRIDRETLCGRSASCYLSFDAVIENPFNNFKFKVEIQDVNDNSPQFSHDKTILDVIELTVIGTKFALRSAEDPDIGSNSVQTYRLSENQYFTLIENIRTDGSKFPELVLEKPLDRETQDIHALILTSMDGGNPVRSGTTLLKIFVTDANDNAPIFTQDMYKVSLKENIPVNSTVIILNATDSDEGVNAQITYTLNIPHPGIFRIKPNTGEIKIIGNMDFELTQNYELSVEAKDGGGLVTHCKVLIEVIDENDNAPDISITSLSTPIPEDSAPGTMIALIEVHDQDSGDNADVDCYILEDVPFSLLSSDTYYRLVLKTAIDREKTPSYNITIIAADKGSLPLSSTQGLRLDISDINDNPPLFSKSSYMAYVPENNLPGASIFSIQASDPDTGDNAKIIYSISSTITENLSMSSYLSINIETGVFYAQRSFDYEQNKEFIIEITATDNGFPCLSSNATLIIHIVDQNDNAPKILYPSPDIGGSAVFEMVPFASEPGSLITKVVAVDADSGHNSWLSYHFLQVSDPNHFVISEHTGEIRTLRGFQEKDILNCKMVVMVKDNGNPFLSATTSLSLIIADDFQQVVPKLNNQPKEEETQNNLQLYLVVALGLISLLFIITVMVVIISKCKQPKPSAAFSSLTTNLYPPIDPRTFSMYSDGSLPFPYSYNVCVALDSAEGDFTYMNPNGNVPVENLMDADNAEQGSESIKEASSQPDQNKSVVSDVTYWTKHPYKSMSDI